MLTGAGSFDRQADRVERLAPRTRRAVIFTRQPPLPGRAVRVTYETETRSTTWRVDVDGPKFTLASLSDAPLQRVGTWGNAPAYRVVSGPMRGVLAREAAGTFSFVTDGYAQRYEPELHVTGGTTRR